MYFICSENLRRIYNLTPNGNDETLSSNQVIDQKSATIPNYKTDLIDKVTQYKNFVVKTPIANKVCRIRFYIPSNYKEKVANIFGTNLKNSLEEANGNENDVYLSDEMYNAGDTTGTFVEYTMSAPEPIPEFASVLIDPGHTAFKVNRTSFSEITVNWNTPENRYIVEKLELDPSKKHDSLEHQLNVRIAKSFKKYLEMKGISAYIYDRPEMTNNAELDSVISLQKTGRFQVCVSIHCNASIDPSGWTSLSNTAAHTVYMYRNDNSVGHNLGLKMATALTALRRNTGSKCTDAKGTSTTNLKMLNQSVIPEAYIEVIFYDNMNEIRWLANNIESVGRTMADCFNFSGANQPITS